MRNRGFVLVAALGVAVIVTVLGVAMSFMAQTNLDIASNLRINTEARYAAEAGVDHAIALLKAQPTSTASSLSGTLNNYSYTVTISNVDTSGNYKQLESSSTGTGSGLASTGKYKAVAVVSLPSSGSSGSGNVLGTPGYGLVAEGTVTVNNSLTLAGTKVLGNTGYTFNNYSGFVYQDSSGNTISTASNYPVHAATGQSSYSCNPANTPGNYCEASGTPSRLTTPASVPSPNYLTRRNAALSTIGITNPSSLTGGGNTCTLTISGDLNSWTPATHNGTSTSPKTICITGNANIPASSNLSHVRLVAAGGINFQGAATASDVSLFGISGGVNPGPINANNFKVYSQGDLNFNSTAKIWGDSVLASSSSINFDGATQLTTPATSCSSSSPVGLAVIAGGNITFNSTVTTCAVFLAGGNFIVNQSTHIYGGAAAKGNVIANNGAWVGVPNSFSNSELGSGGSGSGVAAFTVLSRK